MPQFATLSTLARAQLDCRVPARGYPRNVRMPPYFPLCTGARVIETRDIATTEGIISSVSHVISTVTLSVSRYHNSYFARYHGRYRVGKSAVFDVCSLVTRSLTIVANKKQYPHQRNVSRAATHNSYSRILVFSYSRHPTLISLNLDP